MKTTVLLAVSACCAASVLPAQDAQHPRVPSVKVVQGGGPAQDHRQCRRMLVGPGVNQPETYPGYRGFVGWQSPLVLRDGTMLVGFSSGYWHASPPTVGGGQGRYRFGGGGRAGLPVVDVKEWLVECGRPRRGRLFWEGTEVDW